MFQQLSNVSELRPLLARVTGLAKHRFEAYGNNAEMLDNLSTLCDEIQMRTAHLYKIACAVIAEHEKSTMAPAGLIARAVATQHSCKPAAPKPANQN